MKELKEAAENPLAAPPPKVVDHVWKGLTKQEKSKMMQEERMEKLLTPFCRNIPKGNFYRLQKKNNKTLKIFF